MESASWEIFAVPNMEPTVKLLSSSTFFGWMITHTWTL